MYYDCKTNRFAFELIAQCITFYRLMVLLDACCPHIKLCPGRRFTVVLPYIDAALPELGLHVIYFR